MAQSKQYTFNHLFGETFIYKDDNGEEREVVIQRVVIPIIQRDYAQGRNNPDVNRIRTRFIKALYDGLTNDENNILDFVYGDITDKGDMIPLDGQQRLTTLFLLHWYVAKHENIAESECNFFHNFSYETRVSARQFFESLASYTDIDFGKNNLSDDIRNQYWFPYDWEKDPTITSALRMIDEIHLTFKSTDGIWQKLESGLISFYFLSVKDMGLTDDLYIKMNSRGKPLTEFEHFKASLESVLKKMEGQLAERIIKKMDIQWTDMLWPYRGDNNIIDDEFMRYFSFVSTILNYKSNTITFDTNPFELIHSLYSQSKDNVLYLEEMFDIWCNVKDIKSFFERIYTKAATEEGKIRLFFLSLDDNVNIFLDCCNKFGITYGRGTRTFPWSKFLTLYAITEYLRNKDKIEEADALIRLRSINNLINGSQFEMRETRMQAILRLISQIVIQGDYTPIAQSLNDSQLEEERDKQQMLEDNPKLRPVVSRLEDHDLLKGTISAVGLENVSKVDKFYDLFNGEETRRSLVGRAMLTLADYRQKLGWRYQIGTKFSASWEEMFHTPSRQGFDKTKSTLNSLLDMTDSFTDNFLQDMITQYKKTTTLFDWRYYVLKYYDLLPERYGMYYWPRYKDKENSGYDMIAMYTEKSLGGRNWYVILKILFEKMGGENAGLTLADNAFYGDGGYIGINSGNKVYYLTMSNVCYEVALDEQVLDNYTVHIKQSDDGIDLEDRVLLGCSLIQRIKNDIAVS